LCTDKETGIVGNQTDIKRRQKVFGKNKIAIPTISSFFEILAIQFEEANTMFLIVVATIYLLISLFLGDPNTFNYCLTIFFGVFFAAILTALCEFIKQKQFLTLKD
jgi:magnesium-transporting ATPase (P-type)